jgi:hypothetical protein
MALSDAERATAAQLQGMIAGDIERSPLPHLAEDVRLAIMRSDKPAMFLYARLLGEKRCAARHGAGVGSGSTCEPNPDHGSSEHRSVLATQRPALPECVPHDVAPAWQTAPRS